LTRLRSRFEVSMEACLIRCIRMAATPSAVFAASPVEAGAAKGRYRIDYLIPSRAWAPKLTSRTLLPQDTCVSQCTAMAHTTKGTEEWHGQRIHVEAVGIAPYPWSSQPRVAGVLWPIDGTHIKEKDPCLTFLVGDALR